MQASLGGFITILVGLVSILGAIQNWHFVVGPGKLIPRLLGPKYARLFMILLGVALIILGMGILLG